MEIIRPGRTDFTGPYKCRRCDEKKRIKMLGFFQKKNRDKNRETWIIAGLGNPGPEYSDSRHNCGFRAIDKLKEKIGYRPNDHQ